MFEIYIESEGGTRHHFSTADTEAEAIDYCEQHNWKWLDENCFEWSMDYSEI